MNYDDQTLINANKVFVSF